MKGTICDFCSTQYGVSKLDLIAVDPKRLEQWNRAVPRYTSYPTAPQFYAFEESAVRKKLAALGASDKPLSLYIHIPFCRSMCLFCGCSVILNRQPQKQADYLALLLQEIALAARCIGRPKTLTQLHLGGGTPTSLDIPQFEQLMKTLRERFQFADRAELSIEIDPRTVFADGAKKLEALWQLGFNRVSFGVQDLDPNVQEAVKRRQTEEMTSATYHHARRLGFEGINIDLIYGLPLQTPETFARTTAKILALAPDRIALFSYAKVPWLKSHQKAIREEDLPTDADKFQIYAAARRAFMEAGYDAIGMDHFALRGDSLARAYREGNLTRNFQGYSVGAADDLLGLGVTSIGFLDGAYVQNVKTIEEYQSRLSQGMLPVFRGYELTREDSLRRWTIQQIMCRFRVDKREFEQRFQEPFDAHFAKERRAVAELSDLAVDTPEELYATPLGKLFIRLVAAAFDAYVGLGQFSKAI